MSNTKRIRTAVIGLGAMGLTNARRLFNNEIPELELSAICDLHAAQANTFPGVPLYLDWRGLMASGKVDAVVIATPHYEHVPISIEALCHGLHVLVEKPMGVRKSDCEKLIAAHAASDRVLSVMLSMRTRPVFQKIRKMIQSGELGRLRRVNWIATDWFRTQAYYQTSAWRGTWKGEGGGLLLNQCPHQLDIWWWLFGMPSRVSAQCTEGRYHNIETEDDVTAFLTYEDGLTGVFSSSTGESPGTNRLEIVGENGKLVTEHGKLTFYRNTVPMTEFSHATDTLMSLVGFEEIEIPLPPAKGGHVVVLQNFARTILNGEPLLAPGREGVHGVELANAMHLSSWTNAPVAVPLDTALFDRLLEERSNQNPRGKAVA